jgi:hypothetical protein
MAILRYNSFEDFGSTDVSTIDVYDIVYGASFTNVDQINDADGIDADDTDIVVDDVTGIEVLDAIKIDSEIMKVIAVNAGTNTLTVVRGYCGTTAASHLDNAVVQEVDDIGFVYQKSVLGGSGPETGTARAGTASTIQLKATPANNITARGLVRITAGTGSGQIRRIITWANATRTATISPNWGTNPDATSVYSVENRISVALIKGNFAAGGETIYNQDEDACTTTQTGTGTSVAGNTYRPDNVVIVTGDNSSSSDIFRDIQDASISGSWALHTAPSTSTNFLKLNAMIVIGRRDDIVISQAISENEMIDILTDNVLNYIPIVGNSSYKATLRIGNATYKSGSEANFPPKRTYNGDVIKAGTGNAPYGGVNGSIIITATGELRCYGTEFQGSSDTYSSITFQPSSTALLARCSFYDCSYFSIGSSGIKISDVKTHDGQPIILGVAGVTYSNFSLINTTSYTVFLAGVNAEGDIEDTEMLDSSEDPVAGYGGTFGDCTFHLVNLSHICTNTLPISQYSGYFLLDEKTFDLNVRDEAGNAISGATVTLTDKDGYSALFSDSGGMSTGTYPTYIVPADTTIAVNDADLFTAGRYYRIQLEIILVNSIDSGANTISVSRGQKGTEAWYHDPRKFWLYEESLTTDASGDLSQRNVIRYWDWDSTGYCLNPFTLTIKKPGYKTYKSKINIGHATSATSYKTDVVKLKITLKKNRFREERSLPQ